MTSFIDGPAKDQVLTLKRTPIFLRVVDDCGTWDALDQLDDTPTLTETLHAYRLKKDMGHVFVDGTDKRGRRTGYSARIASYEYVQPQPDQQTMRNPAQWQAWCEAQPIQPRLL